MLRRRLLPILLLLAGCGVTNLAASVPVPRSVVPAPVAAPTTTTTLSLPPPSPSTSAPVAELPPALPRPADPRSGGLADVSPGPPVEDAEIVDDPGSDDPGCTVPARRRLDTDHPHYVATVAADPATGTVSGRLTVTFTADQPIDRVHLRLWANSPRIAAAGGRIDVGAPMADGLPARLEERDPTTAAVVLPTLLPAGMPVTVGVDYHLVIPGASEDRVSLDGGALRLGSFLPLVPWESGGRGWDLDPPTSGFAEAATSPAADWDVILTVPAGYQVLGSGSSADGIHWTARGARDVAFTVGHLALARATAAGPHPVAVTVGVADGAAAGAGDTPAEAAAAYAAQAADALSSFAGRFGAYPWRQLSVAVTGGLDGGIEFPGHVMLGPDTIGRTTIHEVAHQWFYGLVGNNQARDPVLDEGLATFAELSDEGLLAVAEDWTPPPLAVAKANQSMEFWEQHLDDYYLGVYVQGARGLAALGPTGEVDCALRRYVATQAFAIATPAALIESLSSVFPNAAGLLVPYGIG